MKNRSKNPEPDNNLPDDRVEILFRELELAIKWERPSVLFAIYRTGDDYQEASEALESRLVELGQLVPHIQIEDQETSPWKSASGDLEKTVFFVDGISNHEGKGNVNTYAALNVLQDFFVENQIRIVFWLTEDEAIDLAHYAPDFWAFRHRVIEFATSPKLGTITQDTKAKGNLDEVGNSEELEKIDAKINFRESLLNDWPEGDDSTLVYANLLQTLGILHWRKTNFEKAEKFLNTASDLGSKMGDKRFEAECLNALGLVHASWGNFEKAIDNYQQANSLAPELITPWTSIGHLYLKLNQLNESKKAFLKALEKDPKDSGSWKGLGVVNLKMGLTGEAIPAFQKTIEISPSDEEAWNGLAEAYVNLGKTDDAVAIFQKATEFIGHLVNPWMTLGQLLLKSDKKEQAIRAFQKVVELDPKNCEGWAELISLQSSMGASGEVMELCKRAILSGNECGELYCYLGNSYVHERNYDEANEAFLKCISLPTNDKVKAEAWNGLGDIFRRKNDTSKAMEAYQRALELNGDSITLMAGSSIFPQATSRTPQISNEPMKDEPVETMAVEDADSTGERTNRFVGSELQSLVADSEEEEPAHDENLGGDENEAQAPMGAEPSETQSNLEHPTFPTEEENPINPDDSDLEVENDTTAMENENAKLSTHTSNFAASWEGAVHWNEIGHTHLRAAAYDDAIHAYKRAIELAPELSWPYINNLAIAYYHKGGNKDKTQPQFPVPSGDARNNDDIPTDPTESENMENHQGEVPLGKVLTRLEKALIRIPAESNEQTETPSPEQVGAVLDESDLSTGPDELEPGNKKAGTIASIENAPAGDGPKSVSAEDKPKDAFEWNEAGNIYFKAGSYDKAASAFLKAIDLAPEYGWPYSNLALVYCHKGRYPEAIPLYEKSIDLLKSDKEKSMTWNRLGDAFRRLNDHDNAMTAYQNAAELDADTNPLLMRARLSLLSDTVS